VFYSFITPGCPVLVVFFWQEPGFITFFIFFPPGFRSSPFVSCLGLVLILFSPQLEDGSLMVSAESSQEPCQSDTPAVLRQRVDLRINGAHCLKVFGVCFCFNEKVEVNRLLEMVLDEPLLRLGKLFVNLFFGKKKLAQ
jgi:hypothetical protein